MATIDAIEKAVDDSFLWGQINILEFILGEDTTLPGSYFQLLLKKGGFEEKRNELFWSYSSWCLAHNVAVACLAAGYEKARLGEV